MGALAEQPYRATEFDRYTRTYNDATTWLAEILEGSMRTPFEYRYDGQEFYAQDGGALGPIFEDAVEDAKELAEERPELAFEYRRRLIEQAEYQDMLGMAEGTLPNTMVVVSDFPPELMTAAEDVGGYNVSRKQTMLRVLIWQDGRLQMYSQTLDGSDRTALEAIYSHLGNQAEDGELLGQRLHVELTPDQQNQLTDELMGVYDNSLSLRYGGHWHGGRQELARDTYQFVTQQHALIERFVTAELNGGISDFHKYNIAALVAKRYEEAKSPAPTLVNEGNIVNAAMARSLDWQLRAAGNQARAEGRVFSGCGASARANSVEDGSPLSAKQELGEAGYGGESDTSESKVWKWKQGKCRIQTCPTRPGSTKVGPCEICVGCQAKFDAGLDPTKLSSTTPPEQTRKKVDAYERLIELLTSKKTNEQAAA